MREGSYPLLLCLVFAIGGCDSLPGKPKLSEQPLTPVEVRDFATLYADNCAGCHGANGSFGAATQLNNPVYLALVDEVSLRRAIAKGVPGTSMPPFAIVEGGSLTDEQIATLVKGMQDRWAKPGAIETSAPSYAAKVAGNAESGAKVYSTFCESCHGADGNGGSKAGSIVDGWYLSLSSDQSIRTLIIAGRSDLGHPDWRGYPGKALSAAQVSDLVAWIASNRPEPSLSAER